MAKQEDPVPKARPFLKWAGGKTQLLEEFGKRLPADLKNGKISNYVEPFIGGGAVFFYLNAKFPFEERSMYDANEELILTYQVIQRSVGELISRLDTLESAYLAKDAEMQKELFYEVRDAFNKKFPEINFRQYDPAWVERAAQIIFLNRTCFNGLFRVNRRGEFNVPFGGYKKPVILNKDNLNAVAALLQKTRIMPGDFTCCREFVDDHTFVYLDPPYRPLNHSSSFTSYSKDGFYEEDQIRLVKFFKELDESGAKIMLSNSDPKNENPDDTFFDDLFSEFFIERVPARRRINCDGAGRGDISELIITNYPPDPA